jgi:hypothetical protein
MVRRIVIWKPSFNTDHCQSGGAAVQREVFVSNWSNSRFGFNSCLMNPRGCGLCGQPSEGVSAREGEARLPLASGN